jgi:putative CocE/NonD family hydrolase
MNPGFVYQVKVELLPTANVFKAGHKIRVDVSSSNFPKFDINPNTGEDVGQSEHVSIAINRVYMGSENPSCVVLPVLNVLPKELSGD